MGRKSKRTHAQKNKDSRHLRHLRRKYQRAMEKGDYTLAFRVKREIEAEKESE